MSNVNISLEISDKNNINEKYTAYCSNRSCSNKVKKDYKLAIVNRYYYLFCSEDCWKLWINKNSNDKFIAQFKNYEEYYDFIENFKKKDRNYCYNYYSRNNYCGF